VEVKRSMPRKKPRNKNREQVESDVLYGVEDWGYPLVARRNARKISSRKNSTQGELGNWRPEKGTCQKAVVKLLSEPELRVEQDEDFSCDNLRKESLFDPALPELEHNFLPEHQNVNPIIENELVEFPLQSSSAENNNLECIITGPSGVLTEEQLRPSSLGCAVDQVLPPFGVKENRTRIQIQSSSPSEIKMSDSGSNDTDSIEMAGPGEPGPSDSHFEVLAGSDSDHQVAVSSAGAEVGSFQVHQPPPDHVETDTILSEAELEAWGALHNLSDEAMSILQTCGPGVCEDVKTLLVDQVSKLNLGKDLTEELLIASKCLDEPCPHENVAQDIAHSLEEMREDNSGAPIVSPDLEAEETESDSDSDSDSDSEADPIHMIDVWGKLHKLDDDVLELLKRLGFFTLDRVSDLTEEELVKLGLAYDQVKEVLGAIQCLRIDGPCPHVESQASGVEIAAAWDARFGMNASSDLSVSNEVRVHAFREDFNTPLDIHLDAWATLHSLDKNLLSVLQRLGYTDLKSVSKITQEDLDRLGISGEHCESLLEAVDCLQNEGPCPHITATVVTKSTDLDEDARKDRPKSRYGKGKAQPSEENTKVGKLGVPEDNIITFTKEGDANILTSRRVQGMTEDQRKEMVESSNKTQVEEFAQAQILEVLHGLAAKPCQLHKALEVATKGQEVRSS
jgi:hypothetical protein